MPYGDPDLLALHSAGGDEALRSHLTRPISAATGSMSDVLVQWPAADASPATIASVSRTWRTARTANPTTLLPTRLLGAGVRPATSSAARQLSDGTPVIAYDEGLSAMTSSGTNSGARVQRALADSYSMYLENPAASRSAMVVVPRIEQASPGEIASVIGSLTRAPWTRATVAETLRTETPTPAQVSAAPSPAPTTPPRSPITRDVLARVGTDRRLLGDMGTVLVDSSDVVTGWSASFDEIASTRWRGQAVAHTNATKGLHDAVTAMPELVAVRPASINFLTDSGQVGVVVVNQLNRPVRNLRLVLTPRRYVLAVEEQPEPLSLNADSRATVRVPLQAIAAGRVRMDAVLTTPGGTTLGAPPDAPRQLEFNVRPTATWLYWVMGAVAGPILVMGLIRSLRRGPRPRTELDGPTHEPTSDEPTTDATPDDQTTAESADD